jgi:hypothetical protein
MGDRCPRRAQCEAAKQAAYANNNGGNGNNNRRHNNGGNRRHNNGNNNGNSNRRMPQPPPYHGPQGGNVYMTVNNVTVNNYNMQSATEDKGFISWLKGKIAGAIGGREAAEAMFKGQLPSNA